MAAKTPQTINETLAAGETKRIFVPTPGRYFTVLTCSAASFRASFDGHDFQTFYSGVGYPIGETFDSVWLQDSLGAGCTIIAVISESPSVPVNDSRNSAFTATIAATLADILVAVTEVRPYSTCIRVPQTLVQQTGVGVTQIVTANALNREVEITCDSGNAGYIYLAATNDVTQADSITELMAGGSWNRKWKGDVWACSTNGTEIVRASIWRQ
jgi:hypothetical protein